MSRDVWADDLFLKYDRLVTIFVCGLTMQVPENNSVLRGFQFVNSTGLVSGSYCWNGDCTSCLIWIEDSAGKTKKALACQTVVTPDMRIADASAQLKSDLGL
ncbi:MAG: 2Fe-2S iron-sulfur cluster-binding protein [Blastocatellia bacterium]